MLRNKFLKVALISSAVITSGGLLANKFGSGGGGGGGENKKLVGSDIGEINFNSDEATLRKRFEPSTRWDFNWDKREPSALIKPKRSQSFQSERGDSLRQQKTTTKTSTNDTGTTQDDQALLKKHSSKATRHLFLIRHGQYEYKEKEKEKKVLTQLGREQAEETGKYLIELARERKFKFTKLHYSTLIRAVQTAEIIKTHLPADTPINIDSILCEGSPIPPEPPVGHWRPELDAFQDGPRIEAAFRRYFHRAAPEQIDDSFEIIVCHANVIRYFFCRALQFAPEAWLRFELSHGSLTHIYIRPDGRVFCRVLGENGFQPISKLSS